MVVNKINLLFFALISICLNISGIDGDEALSNAHYLNIELSVECNDPCSLEENLKSINLTKKQHANLLELAKAIKNVRQARMNADISEGYSFLLNKKELLKMLFWLGRILAFPGCFGLFAILTRRAINSRDATAYFGSLTVFGFIFECWSIPPKKRSSIAKYLDSLKMVQILSDYKVIV